MIRSVKDQIKGHKVSVRAEMTTRFLGPADAFQFAAYSHRGRKTSTAVLLLGVPDPPSSTQGFGESPYLKRRLRTYFEDQGRARVSSNNLRHILKYHFERHWLSQRSLLSIFLRKKRWRKERQSITRRIMYQPEPLALNTDCARTGQ